MMTLEEEKDMAGVAEKVISHAENPSSMKIALLAALRLFHSMGYRSGYADAMDDAKNGRDRRVVAHLN
jgi:hypothetical protein